MTISRVGARPRATRAARAGSGRAPTSADPLEAGNGAPGGSFRPAPDAAAAQTAESRGNRQAHATRRDERSSQDARTGLNEAVDGPRWPSRPIPPAAWAAPGESDRLRPVPRGGEDAAEAEPEDPADAEKEEAGAEAAGGAARRLGP